MIWYLFGGIAVLLLMMIVIGTYIRDRRYERKKVSQAMRTDILAELEEEREEALQHHEHFRKALKEAEQGGKRDQGLDR